MCSKSSSDKADLILCNAKIWTVDGSRPVAEAVAICGTEIVAVGANSLVGEFCGDRTRIVDLQEHLVLPGFNDAHTHFLTAALRQACALNLYGVATLQELQSRLSDFANRTPGDEWLIGWRWVPHRFEGGSWPTRADLDNVETSRPVAVFDVDGHSCWVNTRALQLLGYDADSLDPLGGSILRDEAGRPTGILLERAWEGVPRVPSIPSADFAENLLSEFRGLNRLGITSISDNGAPQELLDVCIQMATEGAVSVRVNEWLNLEDDLSRSASLRDQLRTNEVFRVVGLKTLLDGVLSSRTAWLLEPYADNPGTSGYVIPDLEHLLEQMLLADNRGMQIVIHAIGDRAVRRSLDLFQTIDQRNRRRVRRHRIEHAEVIHQYDHARFSSLGVIACMMPLHCTASMDAYVRDRLGTRRAERAYPWRDLLANKAHLCFGTDWPAVLLETPNPLDQIHAAVTRRYPGFGHDAAADQRHCLAVPEAIQCYTLEPAYAEFMDHRKGSISVGKLADLVVLSKDILQVPPEEILDTEVLMTVFDGDIVHQTAFG